MVIIICIHGTGILRSRIGDARSDEELTSEEISLALLPTSLFQNFTDDMIGIFFAFYKNASPFPVANVSNTTRIGSPVVGATVVAGEQTSFYNLIDPVTITVRLNPVQEGVSVYVRSIISKYTTTSTPSLFIFITCPITEHYTSHMCVVELQPCR